MIAEGGVRKISLGKMGGADVDARLYNDKGKRFNLSLEQISLGMEINV